MIKIIAVDDDPAFLRDLEQKVFSSHDKEFELVLTMSNMREEENLIYLLDKVNTLQPDVILMDMSFSLIGRPHDFGIELVHRVLREFPKQKIIMLVDDQIKSDGDLMDKVLRSFSAGAVAYIGKREMAICREAILEVIDGERYISKETAKILLNGITFESEAARRKYRLSARQIEILYLLSMDLDTAQVARHMKGKDGNPITIHTVNFHLRNIRRQMIGDGDGGTLHGLVAKALREKIIE